jgi:hypothetical protein
VADVGDEALVDLDDVDGNRRRQLKEEWPVP